MENTVMDASPFLLPALPLVLFLSLSLSVFMCPAPSISPGLLSAVFKNTEIKSSELSGGEIYPGDLTRSKQRLITNEYMRRRRLFVSAQTHVLASVSPTTLKNLFLSSPRGI